MIAVMLLLRYRYIMLKRIFILSLLFSSAVSANDVSLSSDVKNPLEVSSVRTIPNFDNSEQITIGEDRNDRMTINVAISHNDRAKDLLNDAHNSKYKFIIDTAAQRTVLSSELADKLALEIEEELRITTLSGPVDVRSVYVPQLTLGTQNKIGLIAPTFKKSGFGADGILGLDSLQGQRILFDFKNDQISVQDNDQKLVSRNKREIIVRAKRRDGQLIFTDATISGIKVNVIIDTGGELSVGNLALKRRLGLRDNKLIETNLIDVNGQTVPTEVGIVHNFKLDRAQFAAIPMAFADSATFEALKLTKRPAIFLGMDALRKFDKIAIDFEDRRIYFLLPEDVKRAAVSKSARGLR